MPELIDDLFASFVRDLKASGMSDQTVKTYRYSMKSFTRWLEAARRPVTDESLTKHAIVTWLGALTDDQKLAGNTRLTYFRGMRRFCRWLLAEGELQVDPFKNLQQPPPAETPVPILSDGEITSMIKVCSGKAFADRRDEAILRVFFDCGLRISELANLTVDDVDMSSDVVVVMGKGSRPRAVPFSAKTARSLDRYIRMRRQHKHAEDAGFWLSQRGSYSADGIDHRLRVRAAEAGVKDVHAHRFRHTFAHDWLAAEGQERDLMRLAGWTSTAMLARYGASAATQRAHDAKRKMRRGDRL